MNKRTFLKTSSALATGAVLSQLAACQATEQRTNWAGNFAYSAQKLLLPSSLAEAQEMVKKSKKVRALGSRHSFNSIADCTQDQISLQNLNKVISLDKEARTVTVQAAMRYGELCQYLHQNGFALHNLASLPHISIAGACATATHGSGINNGNLATAVTALEWINPEGDLNSLSRAKDKDQFLGAVVGLGGLGIVTQLTLSIQPTYDMQQVVYQNMPMKVLEKDFEAIMSSGYSVSLFTDWQNQNINQVWIKSRIENGKSSTPMPEFYGARLATKNLHPLENLSAENCTEQMGVVGPWYERLPHFKMGFMPSSGKELQSEYFVPIEYAYRALMSLEKLHAQVSPHLLISEIRVVDADDLWMSPCYKQACVAFHFTWQQDWEAVKKILPLIETQLAPFNARPHWGKLFTMAPATLQKRIDSLDDFKQLLGVHDPRWKFRNDFLIAHIF
ncbi:MAG: FAD-binding protein [Runella sp.]